MTIGEFIRMKRLAAGMSQATLYKALPTQRDKSTLRHGGRARISNIECNRGTLSFEQFCAIAEALGYTASEFLREFENGT